MSREKKPTSRPVKRPFAIISRTIQPRNIPPSSHLLFGKRRTLRRVPDHVRHRGPWQGMHRGEMANLQPDYWLDLQELGYVLLRCKLAVFELEA